MASVRIGNSTHQLRARRTLGSTPLPMCPSAAYAACRSAHPARRSADRPSSNLTKGPQFEALIRGKVRRQSSLSFDTPLLNFAAIHTRRPHRVPAGHPLANDLPPGGGCVSPSDPRAQSSRRDSSCRPEPSCSRPRTAARRHGAAQRGRPPSPVPAVHRPGRTRIADAAQGILLVPCATADRSRGARRSGEDNRAPPLLQSRSASPQGGAQAAGSA